MLVLRPVVDQQQELGRRYALDQAVEEGLGLGIDPVQILTDQQQRLHLAFAHEEALEPVERALAPLRWIERQEQAVRWQSVQEGEQRRDHRLQRLVQGEDLPGHLGPDGARVITLLDVAIALEEVNDGEIRRGLAIRHRGAFEHQPALGTVGVAKLIEQPRLPHAGLAHQRHHLTVPGLRLCQGLLQGLQLGLPPHKAGEATSRGRLQARPHHAGARHLVDFHWVAQAPDGHGPQRLDPHKALD
jgi:hypothetical protein